MSKTKNVNRMRRFLLLILALVLIKAWYAFFFIGQQSSPSLTAFFNTDVSAQVDNPPGKSVETPVKKGETDNRTEKWDPAVDFEWSYDLIKALQERESQMRMKEEEVKKQQERISEMKKEIENRMEALSQIEAKIAKLIETKKAVEDEKVRKLAKVFESTPPEQAGVLMSKIDVDIAAQLILKMTGRKAGKIWGFVTPEKAVAISKELARINPNIDMNKISGE